MNALFITGPTSAGKTGIAIRVAELCNGEIVGADAFQVYKELDILSAKPSRSDRARVPHHLIGVVPILQGYDVAQYLDAARSSIADIVARGKFPVVCGGTGLYLRALIRGLSDLPKADASLRTELDGASLDDLQRRYTALDPAGAARIDLKNKRRLVRAIEVCILTQKPFSSFRDEWKTPAKNVTAFLLTRERDDLHERINRRVVEMFHSGAVEEVRQLTHAGATAIQAIGFGGIRALIAGECTEAECIACVQQATRRYAKRQLTWFRREPGFETINLTQCSDLELVAAQIAKKGVEISDGGLVT